MPDYHTFLSMNHGTLLDIMYNGPCHQFFSVHGQFTRTQRDNVPHHMLHEIPKMVNLLINQQSLGHLLRKWVQLQQTDLGDV